MSIRATRLERVASCTPLEMQRATFGGNHATGNTTAVQQTTGNPHGIRGLRATMVATPLQPEGKSCATRDEKLHVAFTSTCNLQPTALSAHRINSELLKLADKVCDHYGDGEAARQEMRDQCMELPLDMRLDLLEHFRAWYRLGTEGEQGVRP